MQTFNIHDAKTQLSRLVEQAAKGESFVIAKAGKPMVKVMALNAPESSQMKRIGFLAGQVRKFRTDGGLRDGRAWRFLNEIPSFAAIAIVILVVVKPF